MLSLYQKKCSCTFYVENLYTSWRKPVYFIGEILYTLLYRLHLESLRDKLIILQYQLNFNEERSLAHKQENSVIDDLLGK